MQDATKGLNPEVRMKDSGIDWIGEIPIHWKTNFLKRKFTFKKGRFGQLLTASFLEDSEAKYPVYSGQTKDGGVLGFWSNYEFNYPDGVIFSTTVGAKCMSTRWVSDKFSLSQNCMIMIPKEDDIDTKYSEFFLRYYFLEEKKKLPLIMQPSLRFEDLIQFQILLPPIEEQRRISTYLDSVEKRIDKIADLLETTLVKLEEKRSALITQAVTKGLEPDVQMKDSGINWIRDVPENWEIMKFARFTSLQQGLQIPIAERKNKQDHECYEYITVKSIHNPNLPKEYIKSPNQNVICSYDDILYGRTGNTGEVVTNVEGVFHNNFFKINWDKSKFDKEFLCYILNSKSFKQHIMTLAGTTTIPDINHGDFLSCEIPFPPMLEQKEIAKYISDKVNLIDAKSNSINSQIKSLNEYRIVLISAAVTGKIDVRSL